MSRAAYERGLFLKSQGRLPEALEAFASATDSQDASLDAFIEASILCGQMARVGDAIGWMLRAEARFPDSAEPAFLAGSMYANVGRHADSAEAFGRAIANSPAHPEAHRGLINALRKLGRPKDAIRAAQMWAEKAPESPLPFAILAHLNMTQARPTQAVQSAERACALDPDNFDNRVLLARSLELAGRIPEALEILTRISERAPERHDLSLHLAHVLKVAGRQDLAREVLKGVAQTAPQEPRTYLELAEITDFARDDALIAPMEALLSRAESGKAPRELHYALAKAYDDLDKPDAAFAHLQAATRIERGTNTYDENATLSAIEQIKASLDRTKVESLAGSGSHSALPIFIIGMPRSGTTLVEQILSQHGSVQAAGEVPHLHQAMDETLSADDEDKSFPSYLASIAPDDVRAIAEAYLARMEPLRGAGTRVTDKMPSNSLLAGLIHIAFPHAAIIHCIRDPLDTCLSCFMNSFGERHPYSRDLSELGRYFRAHEVLMGHWANVLPAGRMLEVQYERLVTDLEAEARRIIRYCGLDWDPNCLEFYKSARPVSTASLAQVRRPIYTSSVGRWKRYRKHLIPLLTALGKAAP